MAKYELSLSPEYVSHWGIVEAVREIFQNAIDQAAVQEDNPMFFSYEKNEVKSAGWGMTYEQDGVLRIGNRDSILDAKSLLLGATTKRDDQKTIGQFGEGYKIATLVLLRSGKQSGIVRADVDERIFAYCIDNIFMMYQFSFSSNYYKERLNIYLGTAPANGDMTAVEASILAFIRAALS